MESRHVQTFVVIALISTLQSCRSVNGLNCFKCLNIDCSSDDSDCQQDIRSFVANELERLYYFDSYLENCPPLTDTNKWLIMQSYDDPCPEQKKNEATCTLGRMEIKTVKQDSGENKKETFHYATVMGCARRQLVTKIISALKNSSSCDYTYRNVSDAGNGITRHLRLEHCMEISSQCNEKDYCVSAKQSIVKPWRKKKDNRFDFSITVGMLALVFVVIMALLFAGLCTNPVDRLSNRVKDGCGTMKILRNGQEYELDAPKATIQGNKAGTLGRRPAHPPPPPPQHNTPKRETCQCNEII